MQAYRVVPGGKQDALRRVDYQPRALAPHEVLVRVGAVALNYRDVMIAEGIYPISGEHPPIAFADGAGTVIETGAKVSRFKTGDRVARIYFSHWHDGPPTAENNAAVPGASEDGMLAAEIEIDEGALVKVPDHLDDAQAAALSCAGVTAWQALFEEGRVRPGDTVLLLGTGGVSIWALQLAKAAGLRVIITSSSDAKLERARALGADETINYRAVPEWQDEALRRSGGRGVDLTVEVGGRDTLNRSVAATRVGGTVVLVGGISSFSAPLEVAPTLVKHIRLSGIAVGSRAMFEALNRFVAAQQIRPVVDRVFPFEQAREAYAYLAGAQHFGKVVIRGA